MSYQRNRKFKVARMTIGLKLLKLFYEITIIGYLSCLNMGFDNSKDLPMVC